MINLFKQLVPSFESRSYDALVRFRLNRRAFTDTVHNDKQLIQLRGTESEQRVRVRRARSSDAPRVLRFVRGQARAVRPRGDAHSSAEQLVLADYVQRGLSQGHSMLAEQITSKRGWLAVRGLALAAVMCPWDAHVLDTWARCVHDPRARGIIASSAQRLRQPDLHDKYQLHNLLQVIMILSPECVSDQEIVQLLAKSSIQRGREAGFALVRFDITHKDVAKALEEMHLKKEWGYDCDVSPADDAAMQEKIVAACTQDSKAAGSQKHFLAVYSARPTAKPEPAAPTTATDENSTKPES